MGVCEKTQEEHNELAWDMVRRKKTFDEFIRIAEGPGPHLTPHNQAMLWSAWKRVWPFEAEKAHV